MKRFYAILLAGLLGYIAYPFLPSKLLGITERVPVISSEPVREAQVKLEEPIVIPDKPILKKKPETRKLGSHKMAKKDELPDIEEEPEDEPKPKVKELDETDFSRIITNGVESGERIDFRKDNIISWKLKEQAFSLRENQYEGVISIEVGTLFGPELRRAKVVIKDENISSWEWLVVDEKE